MGVCGSRGDERVGKEVEVDECGGEEGVRGAAALALVFAAEEGPACADEGGRSCSSTRMRFRGFMPWTEVCGWISGTEETDICLSLGPARRDKQAPRSSPPRRVGSFLGGCSGHASG